MMMMMVMMHIAKQAFSSNHILKASGTTEDCPSNSPYKQHKPQVLSEEC